MAMSSRHLLFALALFLTAGTQLGPTAHGQMPGPYGSGSGGAGQQLAAAQSSLSYAQANVDRLKDRAERSLSHDRNWTAAKAAVAEAKKNREATREQVKEQVMASADYQALQKHLDAASSDSVKAEAQAKMATMVWEAQQNSSDCEAADARLKQAQADLDARWKDYENRVLANDPEWTSAIAARDAARAQVSAALQAQRSTAGASRSGSGSRSYSSSRGSSGSRSSSRSGRSSYRSGY